MRGTAYAVLLLFLLWMVFAIRTCTTDFNFTICDAICDRRGRNLASVEPGLITRCMCGSRKPAPKNMEKP